MTANETEVALTPLEMALNAARNVEEMARASERGALGGTRVGNHGHATAQLAGNLAMVSIAEDLHRIVNMMLGVGPDGESPLKAWARGEDIVVRDRQEAEEVTPDDQADSA